MELETNAGQITSTMSNISCFENVISKFGSTHKSKDIRHRQTQTRGLTHGFDPWVWTHGSNLWVEPMGSTHGFEPPRFFWVEQILYKLPIYHPTSVGGCYVRTYHSPVYALSKSMKCSYSKDMLWPWPEHGQTIAKA